MAPGAKSDAPLAEYWIGAHPKGPAQIELADGRVVSLAALIEQFPDLMLGARCRQRFGSSLPFMLKILSVNRDHGLSIQLHPTKEQARVLRARSPEHYPDDNHKPEVGIALTEVSLLYGCKSPHQVRLTLRLLPGMGDFIGEELVTRIEGCDSASAQGVALVKEIFSKCLTLDVGRTRACVEYLQAKLPLISALARESEILARLVPRYGVGDAGLIAIVFMNHLTLKPGQAIFIGPNVPHAYLDGDLFECMACSDNVVRAGLTPKFKDARALLDLVDCSSAHEGVRSITKGDDGFSLVDTPTEEFRVRVLGPGSHTASIQSGDGPGIVLCVGRSLLIQDRASDRAMELKDGGAVFIPPGSGEYDLSSVDATIFYVTV